MARRSLACFGNASDILAWSNIPFHFFQAAKAADFLTDALNLEDPWYRWHRAVWRCGQALSLNDLRGYQSSRECAKRMWNAVPKDLRSGEIISHFQTFPCAEDALKVGSLFSFFCDATLTQLWEDGAIRFGLRRKTEILRREKEGYLLAHKLIAMSRCCADSYVRDYGADPSKVHVIRPGANLDEPRVRAFLKNRGRAWREERLEFSRLNPARLGFIGVDYRRKGLNRLIDAARILDSRGFSVKVVVIGECADEHKKHPLVKYVGRINKRDALDRFLTIVDSFAIGCLPSYAEPLGISTLECLRMGVPVLGTNVGGIPDCVAPPYGLLVDGVADGEEIATVLQEHLFDPDKYRVLVRGAVCEMEKTTWANTVAEFIRVWQSGEKKR